MPPPHCRSQRLKVLEQKDQVASKMEATMSVEVKAFHCLDCDTILEFRSKECRDHRVKRLNKVPALLRRRPTASSYGAPESSTPP